MRAFAAVRRAFLLLPAFSLAPLTGCNLMDTESGLAPQASAPGTAEIASAPASRELTFWGPAVPLGRGTARAYYTVDAAGSPVSVGVDLSERALEGLPTDGATSHVLKFHPGGVLPYTHVYLDWNPQGHEPPGVYDLPHFDFHFYLMPSAEREAIGPFDDAQFANAPAAQYIPSDYMQIPGGVPQMGAHWIDLLAPEFSGGTFSRTFIWGSYDGEVIFLEPMVTMATLQAADDETVPVRQPAAWQKDGYYPTSYRISTTERPAGVRVSLEGLTFHAGE